MRQRRIESFLLRVVVDDPHDGDPHGWHGRVQHVTSGHERQFTCMQELLAFIREQFADGYRLTIESGQKRQP